MSNNSEDPATNEKEDVFVLHDDFDEDVPGDFFDDFLTEDFMAGLDIVDDDQWENGKMKKKVDAGNSTKKVIGNDEQALNKDSSNNDKTLKRKKGRRDGPSQLKSRGIDADEFDIRRDPYKTKRDIERDKVKCEKDKEKKMISEKLKLVETGLVPPGTEMDVDITEIEKEDPSKKDESKKSLLKNGSPLKRTSRAQSSSHPRRQEDSPRKRSRNRFSTKRSTIRRRSRERISRERFSRNRISRERSIERTLRSLRRSSSISPFRNRRPRYSPEYSRRRKRSHSRDRKSSKKSFLQEIVEKLRGETPSGSSIPGNQYGVPSTSHLHMSSVHHGAMQMQQLPASVPVPTFPLGSDQQLVAPQLQLPLQHHYDVYDESFFIGRQGYAPTQPSQIPPMMNPGHGMMNSVPVDSRSKDMSPKEVEKVINSIHFYCHCIYIEFL